LTGRDASFYPYLGVTAGANVATGINASADLTFTKSWHSGPSNRVTVSSLPGPEYGVGAGGKILAGFDVGYSYSNDSNYGWHNASIGGGIGIEGSPLTIVNIKGTVSNNSFQYHTGTGKLYGNQGK